MTDIKNYFVGLDLGTNSIGWAVTDPEYKVLRFRGKDMKGVRRFDEAQTSQNRRIARSGRRRLARKKQRIEWLQEFFSEEIAKVDPEFFLRLKESRFYEEDKKVKTRFSLFADKNYSDSQYYRDYPTIFHLRKALIEQKDRKFDIRLIYMAIHNILKHRGHFLFEGQSFQSVKEFTIVFQNFKQTVEEWLEVDFPDDAQENMQEILLNRQWNLTEKKKRLKEVFQTKDKRLIGVLNAIAGSSVKLSDLFSEIEFDAEDKTKVEFRNVNYDDTREALEQKIQEKITYIDVMKSVYDWAILSDILKNETYISDAMVKEYEEHKKDLRALKYLIGKYGAKNEKFLCFNSEKVKNNYVHYIRSTMYQNKKYRTSGKCKQENVNKFFGEKLKKMNVEAEDQDLYDTILHRLEEKIALPKMRNSDNGVIPYQVHLQELKKILDNAKKHYPFLLEADDKGIPVVDKILQILTYRIPYFVGPINTYHAEKTGHAWAVKKIDTKIYPWNFDEVIDKEASAEKFIRRMTNKCTYVAGADVIPKESLLYSEFMVLNELNNLRLDGKLLDPSLKQQIVEELFKTNKNVTLHKFRKFLQKKGMENAKEIIITGIDNTFRSSLRSYIDFHDIFGAKINYEPCRSMAENIIYWKCIFGENAPELKKKIKREYANQITNDQLKKILSKNYTGWSRLSKEFLLDIEGTDRETGEIYENILTALRNTDQNLMQLLSGRYTFLQNLNKRNTVEEKIAVTYDRLLGDKPLSAPVKRTIWQMVLLLEEIRKIEKELPKKIMLEMTRSPEQNPQRKNSRREDLIKLYKSIGSDVKHFVDELESYQDADLRSKRLYLYYTQMGKCMYTGKSISLDDVLSNNIKVCDCDHIFPRSLTKDDSLDNLVLVDKRVNSSKSDTFPLSEEIQQQNISFWKYLRSQHLISEKKFRRLTRRERLTADELSGFINRQIVETGQSAKEAAEIIKQIYPETTLIYVKAGTVSDFRHTFDYLKCREVNNLHHADDAYLNIVVGNVYYTKFTANPYLYIRKRQDQKPQSLYNLAKMYEKKVERNGVVAWEPSVTDQMVEKMMNRRMANVTEMTVTQKGELFDLQIKPKAKNKEKVYTPIKTSDSRLRDISKYGGYNKQKTAYYFVAEFTDKKKRVRKILPLYLMYLQKIKTRDDLLEYCSSILHLEEPEIICEKIKLRSKIYYDGYPFSIRGRTGDYIIVTNGKECILTKQGTQTVRKLVQLSQRTDIKEDKLPKHFDHIDEEMNALYEEYYELLKKEQDKNKRQKLVKDMDKWKPDFEKLSWRDKMFVLLQIQKLFQSTPQTADLRKLPGGGSQVGVLKISSDITDHEVVLVHESPTGLFLKKVSIGK